MKQTSKIRTNWIRQKRDSKGRFMPYKELPTKTYPISLLDDFKEALKESSKEKFKKEYMCDFDPKDQTYTLEQLEHAFYAGLKANNSFYPPSKLWEFYKRDRGLE